MSRRSDTSGQGTITHSRFFTAVLYWILVVMISGISLPARAVDQGTLELKLDNAVAIAMSGSYRIKELELGIDRYRKYLDARQAGLKSSAYMSLTSPEIKAVAENKWNSDIQRDEIIRQDTRLWQMDLAIRQPVILLGFPTNGYLSLNTSINQYNQRENGDYNTNYYNRYFVKFTQPLFTPNELKNDLENAELDLERGELDFLNNQVSLYASTANDFFRLFNLAYTETIYTRRLEKLTHVATIADSLAAADSTRTIERIQAKVEVNNTRESILGTQSGFRLRSAYTRQSLRLPEGTDITVNPEILIPSVRVGQDDAIKRGFSLLPSFRLQEINRRKNVMSLEETKGEGSFNMEVEMTYGIEKQDEQYENLVKNTDDSYSATVNAHIPIWDWGQREASIAARKISIDRTDLSIEESRSEITTRITNAVANLKEFQDRTLSMRDNLAKAKALTDMSLTQYRAGAMKLSDLLQNLNRETETDQNFLDAYLGFRQALLQLSRETYYDYSSNQPLMEKLYSLKTTNDTAE